MQNRNEQIWSSFLSRYQCTTTTEKWAWGIFIIIIYLQTFLHAIPFHVNTTKASAVTTVIVI